MVDVRVWPLFGLHLVTPRLELRPMSEGDIDDLAAVIPLDAEMDPELPRLATGDEAAIHRTRLALSYWKSVGNWRPEDWVLFFTVRLDGQAVGVQVLEAKRFSVRRSVETASWLARDKRGLGIGKEMRSAALCFAFDVLSARVALTEAFEHNKSSLGVSRALGYEPNGEDVHDHDGVPEVMLHLRLTKQRWEDSRGNWPVEVTGPDEGLVLFGI